MMLGLTEPTSGEAYVCDINVKREPAKVKEKVGYLPDNVGFYDNMTALENLLFIAQLNKCPLAAAKEDALHLLERVGLKEDIHKKVGKFSRGMIQRLGLADVLIKHPEVIILDEPTLGIDPKGVTEFLDLIVQLSKEERITVLMSSHHLHQVKKICDRVGIFVKGKLIAEGDLNTLSQKLISGNPYLIKAKINPKQQDKIAQLSEHLLAREDIRSIHQDKELLAFNCLKDLSSTISKEIIHHDIDLIALAKKEYGLDEIYQSYFENEEKLS